MIRLPLWFYLWQTATSTIGIMCIVHHALKPLNRWRDRTLAKIERSKP